MNNMDTFFKIELKVIIKGSLFEKVYKRSAYTNRLFNQEAITFKPKERPQNPVYTQADSTFVFIRPDYTVFEK